jgi:hypothetical protein
VSWGIFFLLLPLFMKVFGKITGSALNYGLSWFVWIAVSAVLKVYTPDS